MMETDSQQFRSKDEEIQYWMDYADEMREKKEAVERDLEEFQESSQQLEKELEASLEQAEKTIHEVRQRNSRLATEVGQLRTRLDQQIADCTMFQKQAQELQKQNDQLLKYVRELEQKNDDLERAHRVNRVTEEEIEAKFNSAIEKNALLESELDEKESLKIIVQRLMDENRDLRQEIQVQQRHQPDNDKSADKSCNHVDSNKIQVELEEQTSPINPVPASNIATSPLKIGNGIVGSVIGNNNNNMSPPLAPCTRILAMNMIGDLMRKFGALENKLNTYRNVNREDQAIRDVYSKSYSPRSSLIPPSFNPPMNSSDDPHTPSLFVKKSKEMCAHSITEVRKTIGQSTKKKFSRKL